MFVVYFARSGPVNFAVITFFVFVQDYLTYLSYKWSMVSLCKISTHKNKAWLFFKLPDFNSQINKRCRNLRNHNVLCQVQQQTVWGKFVHLWSNEFVADTKLPVLETRNKPRSAFYITRKGKKRNNRFHKVCVNLFICENRKIDK